MVNILCKLLSFYKGAISPYLGGRCRYVPTCSEYMSEALRENGLWRGFFLGLRRFVRCAPWSESGFDPVLPSETTFK